MMALVAGGTLNSSAANLRTAVKGVASGTLSLENVDYVLEYTQSKHRGHRYLHFEWKLRIRSQRNFESNFRAETIDGSESYRQSTC